MSKNLRISLLALILTFVVPGAVFALPWSSDLWNQPSIGEYEEPVAYPSRSVSKGQRMMPTLMTREEFEEITQNPTPPSRASLERGEQMYQNLCFVCHGRNGKGNGPIIRKGFYPVNLTAPATQARTDGYIYAYIRYGGKVIMPSYRENANSEQAWDIVNYVRKLQGKLNAAEENGR